MSRQVHALTDIPRPPNAQSAVRAEQVHGFPGLSLPALCFFNVYARTDRPRLLSGDREGAVTGYPFQDFRKFKSGL